MKKRIILHVGMHKTGTTFLQRDVFPHIKNIYYPSSKDPIMTLIRKLYQVNPILLDIEEEKKILSDYIDTIKEETLLISSEGLFGHYYSSYQNNRYITSMLHEFFPEAQIFIGIRRQDDWYESLYHQMLHEGRSPSVNQFLNYKSGEFEPFLPRHCLNGTIDVRINMNSFVKHYRSVFGTENVMVLPYEFLKTDLEGFLSHFYTHYGLEPFYPPKSTFQNRSYSLLSCYIAFVFNRVLFTEKQKTALRKFLQRSLDPHFYIPGKFISPKKRLQIMSLHAEANRQLGQAIGMDLSRYGYC